MSFCRRVAVATAVALALTLLRAAPAAAAVLVPFGPCPNPAALDCIVSTTMPGGISVEVVKPSGVINIFFQRAASADPFELSPDATGASTLSITVRTVAAFTPAAVISSGHVVDWTWNPVTRELTISAQPRASSWSTLGCVPGACANTATVDYTAMLFIAVEDSVLESTVPPPAEAVAAFEALMVKFRGGYVSTNAPFVNFPSFNAGTNALEFDLAAPHFKVGGVIVNTGFFRILISDPVFSDLWGIDPLTLVPASLNVTVSGTPVAVTMTRISARGVLPAGWLIEQALVTFSTPHVSISPAAAASVPVAEQPPVSVPESSTGSPVTATRPVQIPRSGTVAVPVTVSAGGASIALPAGTSATLPSGAPFAGVLHQPYAVPDSTGGRAVSVRHFGVTGLPVDGEVRFSRPATLTLPVPAGESAASYQPAAIGAGGALTYLLPQTSGPGGLTQAESTGVSFEVDRLRAGVNHFGLVRVPKPEVVAVARDVAAEAGYHARWAGQSRAVELAPGQLVDLAMRFKNVGDQPWVRGQANLGSAAPLDNTRDHERGVLISPVLGTTRYATTTESSVAPGEVGTFAMRLRAPAEAGTHRILLRPVIDGATWMEDEGAYLELIVR